MNTIPFRIDRTIIMARSDSAYISATDWAEKGIDDPYEFIASLITERSVS